MSNSEIPNQIQDLIANIEEKFDSEFNQQTEQDSPSKNDSENKQCKDDVNPQSDRLNCTQNSDIKIKNSPQQQIVIEEAHQNEENSHMERDQSDLNKKIQLEDQNKQTLLSNQEIEEQDENKYKDLSQKLETALKKISSSKKGFQTQNSFNVTTDFLSRVQEYEKKKEKDLELKRKMEQQKKQFQCLYRIFSVKPKPEINAKSRQMAQQISHRPIYERFDQIVQEKKKKIETNQENKKQLQQQQYEKFMEEYKKHVKVPQNSRDSETYFQDMITWKKKLEKERQDKAKQLSQKQKEGYTFKPQLNKKSVRMLKNQKRVPIQDRQIERPKTLQSQFTFHPKINKRKLP